jgi:hypothetical protein
MYIVALRHNAVVANKTATTYSNCCVALGIGPPFVLLRLSTVASVMGILRTVDSLLWLLCALSKYSRGFTTSQLYSFWRIDWFKFCKKCYSGNMDKQVTSGQNRQTNTVSSNLVQFMDLNKTVNTIVLQQPLNYIVDALCLRPIEFLSRSASSHIVLS